VALLDETVLCADSILLPYMGIFSTVGADITAQSIDEMIKGRKAPEE
jgi:hypothetical protein